MNTREQQQLRNELAALQTRGDHFTKLLLNEKQRSSRLQAQLKSLNEEISDVRESNKKKAVELLNMHTAKAVHGASHRVDGLDPIRLAEQNQKKLVNNLEGRLNKALIRKNNIENENNGIKQKIDKLRRKVHNDNVNRQYMEKDLKDIQYDLDNIMRRAAIASEQKDKCFEQKNQLMRENNEEREKHETELARIKKMITHQNILLENSIASLAKNVVSNSKLETDQSTNNFDDKVDPLDEINDLDNTIDSLEKKIEENARLLKKMEMKNRTYEETFKQLQEVSGLISTDEIVNAFVKNEEETFSLFNFIQTVNQECDTTLEQHAKLEQEIQSYSKEQMDKENERFNTMNNYKSILSDSKEQNQKLIDITNEGKATVLKIAKKVQALFFELKCRELESIETTEIKKSKFDKNKLGMNRKHTLFFGERMDEGNILHRMELIEKRSIQIIKEYAISLSERRRGSRRPSILLVRFFKIINNFILLFLEYKSPLNLVTYTINSLLKCLKGR